MVLLCFRMILVVWFFVVMVCTIMCALSVVMCLCT